MITFHSIEYFFGYELKNLLFQNYLLNNFEDLTEYNITDSEYIVSEKYGLELGFANKNSIFDEDTNEVFEYGNPIFSHINLLFESNLMVVNLPFNLKFEDSRNQIIEKAGVPIKTVNFYEKQLDKNIFIDHYKFLDLEISIDYKFDLTKIDIIQIRHSKFIE